MDQRSMRFTNRSQPQLNLSCLQQINRFQLQQTCDAHIVATEFTRRTAGPEAGPLPYLAPGPK